MMVGYAFVDDTNLCHTARDNYTKAMALLQNFQQAVDCWEGLLCATGGALNTTEKTFWYLIDFKWKNNKWVYLSKAEAPGTVTMRQADSESRVPLTRKEAHEAPLTLGINVAPNGQQEAQMEYLRDKGVEFAESYRSARGLDRNDAWEGMMTTIMATFRYPAVAISLTWAQWNEVIAPVFQAGLNKSGISRMFPRTVLFAPDLFQGLGVMHPFHFQELEHWETILRCGNNGTTTGGLIQVSLEELRLELGVSGMITEWDYYVLEDCATDCWVKTVWKYGWAYAIDLQDQPPQLELRRERDLFLMEAFAQHNYEASDLRVLNQCRTFLQSVTLADVTTADGKFITQEAWNGNQLNGNRINPYDFPRQPPKLPAKHWELW
jgi:hypothetical protein